MNRVPLWPATIAGSALALAALVLADAGSVARLVLSLWFLVVCTGMAYAPLLRSDPGIARLALTLAASLAIDTVVITLLLVLDLYSPALGLAALAAVSAPGCLLQLRRASRSVAPAEVRLLA